MLYTTLDSTILQQRISLIRTSPFNFFLLQGEGHFNTITGKNIPWSLVVNITLKDNKKEIDQCILLESIPTIIGVVS
jgi:hypothetical protein